MSDFAFLAESLAFVEEQYARYSRDPSSVESSWRQLFESAANGGFPPAPAPAPAPTPSRPASGEAVSPSELFHVAQVFLMVNEYRKSGHLAANLDPLDAYPHVRPSGLGLEAYGFTDADAQRLIPNGDFRGVPELLPLGELHDRLEKTYCGTIGVEYHHIAEEHQRNWLKERLERTLNRRELDRDTRVYMLRRLFGSELFEEFLHKKYVGTKRFSIQGAETLIPLIDLLLERGGEHGIRETVLGMAHRGRLNVLHNILDKSAEAIFSEFDDVDPESVMGGGDVKYHLGASCDTMTRLGHELHLSLSPNPSHLEAVNPIVLGRVRAKQRRFRDFESKRIFALLIHGDAAFAGQGLVAETLNLSNLWGYRTGGTIHVVVNNQIGFTATPASQRSSVYATDIAKMIEVPIFHVNGEDPDAVAQVAAVAMDYRMEFQTDVVIDMLCFRRYGHNEGDDPAFTQPLLYGKIRNRPSPGDVYAKRLLAEDVITAADVVSIREERNEQLQEAWENAKKREKRPSMHAFGGVWNEYQGGAEPRAEPDTGVPLERLEHIARVLSEPPEGFHVHRTVKRLLDARGEMGRGERPLDWAMAEHLAFGSLALEGTLVRMSGQDSRRGTFSQRHSAIVDQENGAEYMPLQYLDRDQGEVLIYDSLLSEAGCLGFEFGFSLDYPSALVLWEAQFGDFVNGAQVIIDQFIATSEEKWSRISGLTLLLPHGFEGQGPEHSSARVERFLQLCAEFNMQVCYPSTPAQYFHLLRRQVLRPWRKPLVVLTPKSLLRLRECVSTREELTEGSFQRVLRDDMDGGEVEAVAVCSGKVAYDLMATRAERETKRLAIVRVEQLYPFAEDALREVLQSYVGARDVIWVQEEPGNMGAWLHLSDALKRVVGDRTLHVVARAPSASPATGSHQAHQMEQNQIIDSVFRYVGS